MFSKREAAKQEAEWRTENDLRTYQEYLAICKDKKRLAAVKDLAKKRLTEAKSVLSEVAEEQMEADD